MDIVMGLAAALNIIVINSIKLLIELLVWLTPIPFVDGLLRDCEQKGSTLDRDELLPLQPMDGNDSQSRHLCRLRLSNYSRCTTYTTLSSSDRWTGLRLDMAFDV